METNEFLDIPTYTAPHVAPDEMDWDAYAEHYDLMCDLNPSYQDNLISLASRLSQWKLPESAEVCDLGAGTGNYIHLLSRLIPHAHFTHLDSDKKMNKVAAHKYANARVENVDILNSCAQRVDFSEESFDLILCVNALYAISPQKPLLQKIHSWLRPNGRFFIIDFGRKQRVLDWTFYLFRESLKHHRVGTYVKALIEGREVIKQNRRSTKGQNTGRYWMHSTAAFGDTLVDCGFEIEELFPCYRGYSDLAVCRKAT
jgi:ubiquinone/menaquinone biosynthesis C-methylase UbiE